MIGDEEGLEKYFDFLEDDTFNIDNNKEKESKTETKEPSIYNQNQLFNFSQSERNIFNIQNENKIENKTELLKKKTSREAKFPKKKQSEKVNKEIKDENKNEEDDEEMIYSNNDNDERPEFYRDFDANVQVNDFHLSHQYSENQREEDFHIEEQKMSITEVTKDKTKK